ncbi:hypothetical protein ACRB8A_03220 [Arthrobacter sp. G.S.26]|uniref:hypothetical protein n=1 Tax=Arthrobacter sp. G.S.26 TaxID=3433706 RepID=UPI003D7876BA
MPAHPHTPFHVLRSSAVATGILALAAGAHLAGGGELPAPGIMLAVLALTVLASTTATRLRLGFPAMAALLGGGQVVLHGLFNAFSGTVTAAANVAPAGHHHDPAAELQAYAGLAPLAGHLHQPGASGPLMLAAHALATVGCALLLARGEAALWALAGWLRPLAGLPRAAALHTVPSVPAESRPARPARQPWRNLRWDSRRGPPTAVVHPA